MKLLKLSIFSVVLLSGCYTITEPDGKNFHIRFSYQDETNTKIASINEKIDEINEALPDPDKMTYDELKNFFPVVVLGRLPFVGLILHDAMTLMNPYLRPYQKVCYIIEGTLMTHGDLKKLSLCSVFPTYRK